ncbi:MAG: M64 family metallopeptidase, partial [Planctomycetota bacterium]
TVYDASYGTGSTARCLYIKNTSQALRDAALAPANEGRILVLVNDPRYGGCAGTFAVSYNGGSMVEVQTHEFGHSFGRLADEYSYPNGTYTGGEPSQKNVTTDPTGKRKWPKWIGIQGVSAFEGAYYYRRGIYRPAISCLMRSLYQKLCAVCKEQLVLYALRTVSHIDNPQPSALWVELKKTEKKTFSFANIASSSSKILWRINGATQTATGTSLLVDATTLKQTGTNVVEVEVSEQTPFVKEDPTNLLTKKHHWLVTIAGPPLPDLTISALTSQGQSPAAGNNLDIIAVTLNKGNVDATNVKVDFFLSTDAKITATDPYLGGYTIPLLKKKDGYDLKNPYRVEIPPHTLPGTYYVGAIADREDKIKELNENNNVNAYAVKVTKAGCAARLAYDDPLVYPTNKGTIGIKAGGTLHPTVTAVCNAGSGYLILIGCTGTSPGTNTGSGLTLPLNLDACSTAAYGLVNSPFLQAFLGTLDTNGLGRATLKIPQNTLIGTVRAHMAALVFDHKSGLFRAVSNSVELEFK